MGALRPHVLGIDDAPFEKGQRAAVPIVGVMMEGADLIESVAVTRFPVDGPDAGGFLASWITDLRSRPALQAVILGGITIAGLGLVDTRLLAAAVSVPVLSVTRREPDDGPLVEALRAAGLAERAEIVRRSPRAVRVEEGLYLAPAGIDPTDAIGLVQAAQGKARLPEALRIAHLIGSALVAGESRGRA